jgi:hypothetical protein
LGQQTDCASNMPVIQREAVANKPQLQKQVWKSIYLYTTQGHQKLL